MSLIKELLEARASNEFDDLEDAKAYADKKGSASYEYDYIVLKHKESGVFTVMADEAYMRWPMDHREPYDIVYQSK